MRGADARHLHRPQTGHRASEGRRRQGAAPAGLGKEAFGPRRRLLLVPNPQAPGGHRPRVSRPHGQR